MLERWRREPGKRHRDLPGLVEEFDFYPFDSGETSNDFNQARDTLRFAHLQAPSGQKHERELRQEDQLRAATGTKPRRPLPQAGPCHGQQTPPERSVCQGRRATILLGRGTATKALLQNIITK